MMDLWHRIIRWVLHFFVRPEPTPKPRVIDDETHWMVKSPVNEWIRIPKNGWTFNGDARNPTFDPSVIEVLPQPGRSQYRNHVFIRNGQIQFLDDCSHELRGRCIEIPELSEAELAYYFDLYTN